MAFKAIPIKFSDLAGDGRAASGIIRAAINSLFVTFSHFPRRAFVVQRSLVSRRPARRKESERFDRIKSSQSAGCTIAVRTPRLCPVWTLRTRGDFHGQL